MNDEAEWLEKIGIVASVVWIVCAFEVTYRYETKSDVEVATTRWDNCIPDQDEAGIAECDKLEDDSLKDLLPYVKVEAAIVAFVPVPLGWGFVYLFLFVVRWIGRGFKAPEDRS